MPLSGYARASMKGRRLHAAYEGAEVVEKQYDLLWEEVKPRLDKERMRAATVRLAAAALQFGHLLATHGLA